jgi:hypothetical protein
MPKKVKVKPKSTDEYLRRLYDAVAQLRKLVNYQPPSRHCMYSKPCLYSQHHSQQVTEAFRMIRWRVPQIERLADKALRAAQTQGVNDHA